MTRDEARAALQETAAAIGTAATLIRAQQAVLARYMSEAAHFDSVGPILDPTLFNSSERRAVDAIMRPIFSAGLEFLRAYDASVDASKAALAKVSK